MRAVSHVGLYLAGLERMAATATGALSAPTLAPLIRQAPIVAWALGGALLVGLSVAFKRRASNAPSAARALI
jgi:hypothetical protein